MTLTELKAWIAANIFTTKNRANTAASIKGVLDKVAEETYERCVAAESASMQAATGLAGQHTPMKVVIYLDFNNGLDTNSGLTDLAPLKTLTKAAQVVNSNMYREVILRLLSGSINANAYSGGARRATFDCEKLLIDVGVDGFCGFGSFTSVVSGLSMTGLYGIDTNATVVFLGPTNSNNDRFDVLNVAALPAWSEGWNVPQKLFYAAHRAAINVHQATKEAYWASFGLYEKYDQNMGIPRYAAVRTQTLAIGANAAIFSFLNPYLVPDLVSLPLTRATVDVMQYDPFVESSLLVVGANSRVAVGATTLVHWQSVTFGGTPPAIVRRRLFDLRSYSGFLVGSGTYQVSIIVYKLDATDGMYKPSQFMSARLIWRADMFLGEVDDGYAISNCFFPDDINQYADPTGLNGARTSDLGFTVMVDAVGNRQPYIDVFAAAHNDEYLLKINLTKLD
jgi:hypothetical protein